MTTKTLATRISLKARRIVAVVALASASAGATLVLPASPAFAAYTPTSAVNQTVIPTFTDGETFVAPPGAVYQVPPGGFWLDNNLNDNTDITIDGGIWLDTNNQRCALKCAQGSNQGRAAFTVIGGANVTFENMTIYGANQGGETLSLESNSGIEAVGTTGLTLSDVAISHVFGDCLALDTQVPNDEDLGKVANTDVTVNGFSAAACGMQGISLVDVNGFTARGLNIGSTAEDSFEVETDFNGVGAENIDIESCENPSPADPNANGIQGQVMIDAKGTRTSNITIDNCALDTGKNGYGVWVKNRAASPSVNPIDLSMQNDSVNCGSAPEACLEIHGGDVSVSDSSIAVGYLAHQMPELVYRANDQSSITLTNDTVTGYAAKGFGDTDLTSAVSATGCTWPKI
jgi:hypothetical protein